ncbi:MAG: DUF1565 domain-containing protein [Candidatus Cloacimonetes bacterium]|nr:DUF1565 domain-containing protein [Candidatus Cloacimonadota bacterium]
MKKQVLLLFLMIMSIGAMAVLINIPEDYATIQEGINASSDGDEVIVAPGTYMENINFSGKAITVGSWFYTTQDTSYISQTIIDGNHQNRVVRFINEEDSSSVLSGFKIINGEFIHGGGIYCDHTSPHIENVIISNNLATYHGGGIYCNYSNIVLSNAVLINNSAELGGGYYSSDSSTILENVTITNNSAEDMGGGIYCSGSSINFDSINRCSIYANNAQSYGYGRDIYSSSNLSVIVDTFTVLNPTDLHACPLGHYSFNIQLGIEEQVDADLYVSPAGNDANSGLDAENALQTINHACSIVVANSLSNHTIHLADGTYSPAESGEIFPIYIPSYITISGVSETNTILDAEGTSAVIYFFDVENISLSDVSITQGSNSGIICEHSDPEISNVTIFNNTSDYGGGMLCEEYSYPVLNNVIFLDNVAEYGGGIECRASSPDFTNVTFTNNSAIEGGGIYLRDHSYADLLNVTITGNIAEAGGGIRCERSNPTLENVMIINNSASYRGGGIYFSNLSNPVLTSVTIAGNYGCDQGAGIYNSASTPIFSDTNRSNIYGNNIQTRGNGCDIYSTSFIEVIVDTFTVLNPTEYHIAPPENFSFDILHGYLEQVCADLYVSPEGNNANTGLNANEPLQTIQYACSIILADSLNPLTIHLAEGVYSSSTNGDFFPLNIPSFITLEGVGEADVILDAEATAMVIKLWHTTNVSLRNLTVSNGYANTGGGISCSASNPNLENVTITGNVAESSGGGFGCYGSNPCFSNVTIVNNQANFGGGVYCGDTYPEFNHVLISGNSADIYGGGIYCMGASPEFSDVTIRYNSAGRWGGGICFRDDGIPIFSNDERCSIYQNNVLERGSGHDLYSEFPVEVILDTFTVMNPTDYHVSPLDNFSFDILQGLIEQINNDIYVSPQGDDANSGLNAENPLQTIHSACLRILADSLNQHTIYLAEGIYSPSTNGDFFPVDIPSNVSLTGENEATVILDAESTSRVMTIAHAENVRVSNLTVTNGYSSSGGGIKCIECNPILKNLTVINNVAEFYGGGILCDSSSPVLLNVTISDNFASEDGGGIYCNTSSPILINCILWNDYPQEIEIGYATNLIAIAYTDILGGQNGIGHGTGWNTIWLAGNIDADPLFIDAVNGDYQLTENSPCIDAGIAFFEYEGNVIIDLSEDDYYGAAPDMGACEYVIVNTDELKIENVKLKINAYPNPFNPETKISFELFNAGKVLLEIYNIKGQKVTTLADELFEAGSHQVIWQAKDYGSGVYLLRFVSGENSEIRKLILLK